MATIEQQAAYDKRIYAQAKSMGVPDAVIKNIIGQARVESANYSSPLFNRGNNSFGYHWGGSYKWSYGPIGKVPSYDAQGNPDGGEYSGYYTIEKSTGELVDWLGRRQKEGKLIIANLTTPKLYAQALKDSGYYGQTAAEYETSIISRLKNVDWSKIATAAAVAGGSVLVIAAIVFGFFF